MNESTHPSPEVLAAFVDGRLDGDARAEVVAHLDRCRDCYEVFAGTVRFQRQEEPRGRVLRPVRFGAPQWVWWTAAAAAVLVVAIVVPVVWEDLGLGGREGEGEVLLASAELALALAPGGPGTAAAPWAGWPGGLSFMGEPGGEAVALRVGVRLMDLAAAARSERLDGAGPVLQDLERLLAASAGADALEEDLDRVRKALEDGDARGLERAVARLETSAEGVLDPLHLALGKWAEAGRLAAAAGEATLFRTPVFAGFLETLDSRELDAPAAEALDRIEELTRQDPGPKELEELERIFGQWIIGVE
jgi:hypothetical protein